jgi:lipoate-protein ligase A
MENLKTVFYNLPDQQVLESDKDLDFLVWQPDQVYLVLGRSNEAVKSLIADAVDADKVQVLKRPSGGEAVLLSPNMLVIALKVPLSMVPKAHDVFVIANDIIEEALAKEGIQNITSRGISDICIGEQKILGSAIFKKPNSVFYHAVLNISEDVNLIERYLQHPQREPDYRKGRNHLAFVSSIHKESHKVAIEQIQKTVCSQLKLRFNK